MTGGRRRVPDPPSSTVLSIEEEAIVVAFRRHMLLPFDDLLYALQRLLGKKTFET